MSIRAWCPRCPLYQNVRETQELRCIRCGSLLRVFRRKRGHRGGRR